MIAKYGKQEKYMPKFNDAMCDDYLIIKLNWISLFRGNYANKDSSKKRQPTKTNKTK